MKRILKSMVPAMVGAAGLVASSASADLVAHFTFDNAGDVGENSGTATTDWNQFTAAQTTTAPKFGLGAGIFVPATQAWDNNFNGADLSSFTLSMHVRGDSAVNWQDYASIGDGNASTFKFELNGGHNSASTYTDGMPGGGSVTIAGSAPPTINDGPWHHLGMVSNGSTIELFVDGASKGSAAYTGSGAITAFQLGAAFGNGRNQTADIDDVAIYNQALTAGQMNWLASNEAIASPIPEPSTLALAGMALALLGVGRRMRMR